MGIINQNISQDQNIGNLWDNFRSKVLNITNENIPTKMINNTKKRLPRINKNIRSLIRKRNKLFKRMKHHQNNKNKQRYKGIKLQRESRQVYWEYLENIICFDENLETSQKQKKYLELYK